MVESLSSFESVRCSHGFRLPRPRVPHTWLGLRQPEALGRLFRVPLPGRSSGSAGPAGVLHPLRGVALPTGSLAEVWCARGISIAPVAEQRVQRVSLLFGAKQLHGLLSARHVMLQSVVFLEAVDFGNAGCRPNYVVPCRLKMSIGLGICSFTARVTVEVSAPERSQVCLTKVACVRCLLTILSGNGTISS